MAKRANIVIRVGDGGNIERALRKLKKSAEREGVIRDTKRIVYFEPESQKRRKKRMRAIKQNWIRMAAHQLI